MRQATGKYLKNTKKIFSQPENKHPKIAKTEDLTRQYATGGGTLIAIESDETMKKTIISIIGIAVMLLAVTACRPNYVIMPPIPGGNTSTVPSGTPVGQDDDLQAALANGGAVYLEEDITLPENFVMPENSTIDGNHKTITVPEGTNPGTGILDLAKSGVTLKNVTLDFTQGAGGASLFAAPRAAGDMFAVLIGSGDGNMETAPSGITLSNVTIKTGRAIAGINVHTAKNVTLEDITIDYCLKAPVSISSSTVTINDIAADGSDWYGTDNVIQVNGVGGNPKHQASTIIFKSVGNINKVWVEAVENTYDQTSGIKDSDFEGTDQTKIDGLDWTIRFSNQPSKGTKGWMYYKDAAEATTFTINSDEKAKDDVADELRAMLDVIKAGSKRGVYSTIQLGQDISLDSQLDITIPVTIDGDSHSISRATTSGNDVGTKAAILITSSDVTLKNLSVSGPNTTTTDWDDGEYAIKAYGTTEEQLENVVLDGVTIESANAGMLVRGADVTLSGDIVLNNLEWGGIGVDCKSDDGSLIYDCKLTGASDCSVTGELSDVPAIWTEHGTTIPEGGSEDVVVNGSGVDAEGTHYTENNKNQYWYNLASDTSSNN